MIQTKKGLYEGEKRRGEVFFPQNGKTSYGVKCLQTFLIQSEACDPKMVDGSVTVVSVPD